MKTIRVGFSDGTVTMPMLPTPANQAKPMPSLRMTSYYTRRLAARIMQFHEENLREARAKERANLVALDYLPTVLRKAIQQGYGDRFHRAGVAVAGVWCYVPSGTNLEKLATNRGLLRYISQVYPKAPRRAWEYKSAADHMWVRRMVEKYRTTKALLADHPELASIVAWAFEGAPRPDERRTVAALVKAGWPVKL